MLVYMARPPKLVVFRLVWRDQLQGLREICSGSAERIEKKPRRFQACRPETLHPICVLLAVLLL